MFMNVREQEAGRLWYPHIQYGKLPLLEGDLNEGKSTLMIQIAALEKAESVIAADVVHIGHMNKSFCRNDMWYWKLPDSSEVEEDDI